MCPQCEGTGICPWCSGAGTQTVDGAGPLTPCNQCWHPGEPGSDAPGDGRCAVCEGTGVQRS